MLSRTTQALLFLALWTSVLPAQDIDAEDLAQGLQLRATGPGETSVRQVIPDLALDWGDNAPDPRLASDGFGVEVTGFVLIQQPGSHRFFVDSDGFVELSLDGKPIKVDDDVPLQPGVRRLSVRYRHAKGPARLRLDWSGPGFDREPVPAQLVFHDAANGSNWPDGFESGRRLADQLGCANCHELLNLPMHRNLGPPLDEHVAGLNQTWLHRWLRDPSSKIKHSTMPAMGHEGLTDSEALDLIAFLTRESSRRKPSSAELRMGLNVADVNKGRILFRSLGCLGCHLDHELRSHRPETVGAMDLTPRKGKRSTSELADFLAHPRGAKSSRHRPSLKLTPDESAHLALFLNQGTRPEVRTESKGDPDRGKRLAISLRCAACHDIRGLEHPGTLVPLNATASQQNGCLADKPGRYVPRYDLTEVDRGHLRTFIKALGQTRSRVAPAVLADDLTRRLRCDGCHYRDRRGGERLGAQVAIALVQDPELGRLKGTLTPPNLTAVADKLRPEALRAVLEGTAPTPRPWLSVRMPRFPFQPMEIDQIQRAWSTHDRSLSNQPPVQRLKQPDHDVAMKLIGQKGFGCINCHVLSGRIPPGGEAETLGPDLAHAHQRMTERYFLRWISNPQRIIPGTPMPQFLKPIEAFPGGMDQQRAEIWSLLGSPQLNSLAAQGTREILKATADRVQVVRDMVLVEGLPGGPHVPRGLALGFSIMESALFDTDRLAWVATWNGGFLSRTKSGRLWEWRPEGRTTWRTRTLDPPVRFIRQKDRSQAGPTEIRERFGRFDEFETKGQSATLRYTLHGPEGAAVRVIERITSDIHGLRREIAVENVPDGFEPVIESGTLDAHPGGRWFGVTRMPSDRPN